MNVEQLLQAELARVRAAAWEQGFHVGQAYGGALQRYDPQWDPDGEPARPENPHTPQHSWPNT